MCGITGFFNNRYAEEHTKKVLSILKNRGRDGSKIELGKNFAIGHALHAVVNKITQPLKSKESIFAANCEIYNWKELNNKHRIHTNNDAETLFYLLDNQEVTRTLDELDGVYAFVYKNKDTVILARDLIGIKPIWYSHSKGFAFASEKKALEKIGFIDIQELNPRQILIYDINKDKITFKERKFFEISPELKLSKDIIKKRLLGLLSNAAAKRIPDKEIGILFSGGIDSILLAKICKDFGLNPVCYTSALDEPGMKEASDLTFAKKIAKSLDFKLKVKTIKISEVEAYLKKIVPLIEDTKVTKVSVALTLFLALELAKKDKIKVMFSGFGSDEIFGGYNRQKQTSNINKECLSSLLKSYERDCYRDDVISMYNSIELRLPYLDKALVDFALRIPSKYKLADNYNKLILRELAEMLGIKKEYAFRKKVAAQYGSKFQTAIEKLTKKSNSKSISEYMKRFYPLKNLKLGALVSTGKDSIYAAYVMHQQNYEISCLISLHSKNKASYMFHTPNIELAKLQSEAMELPLISQGTKGEKELELDDLKKALKFAKQKHKIDGIITGAIYSTYQRDRIEKIADSLGLKIFSPLWHINQETELREIIRNKFKVIISSIAAYGLNKSDLGKEIDTRFIEKMVELNKKIGINIAGEGGEFESLVLDCPLFRKEIKILDSEIIMESEETGLFFVKKAELLDKQFN